MVEVNYQNFSLDIDKAASKNLNQVVTGRLGDHLLTGIIVSTLENDKSFDLTGYTIRFEGTTSEGTVVVDADNVEIVDLKAGKFKYTFSNKVFSVLDQYQTAYFAFEKADRRATSENFIISVIQDVDVTWEEAQSYISILNALIRKFNTEWDEFKTDKTKSFDDFVETKETQYQQLTNTANQLGIDFGKLQSSVTQLQKDVPALESKATQLSKDLTALDTKSKDVSIAFETTKKNVDALDITVEDLTKRSNDLKSDTTNLEGQVSTLKTDTSSLEQKTKDMQQVQTDLVADVTEVSKAIEENDVYRKAETFNQQQDGVNVLDTITGTKPTLYSEQLLVDGEQATGSIFVKDQSIHENLLLSKNDLTNSVWTVSKHKAPVIVKDGLGKGIDSIIQEYATTDNLANGYLDVISQPLFSKNADVYKVFPGKWYTLTFRAKGHTQNAAMATFIHPRMVDVGFRMIQNGVELNRDTTVDGFVTWGFSNEWKTYSLSFKTRNDLSEDDFGGTLLFRLNGTHKGHKVELGDFDISEGKEIRKTPTVAPEDYGIVHGQPNLLDGTSNEWKKITGAGGTNQEHILKLSDTNLKPGDEVSVRTEIKNFSSSNNTAFASVSCHCQNSAGETINFRLGSEVNSTGISQIHYTIPEGAITLTIRSIRLNNTVSGEGCDYRRSKAIKGTLEAMDDWTPSQFDSGLTPHDPKTLSEANNLFSADKATLGYFQGWSYKSDLEANANRACSAKIPVTSGKVYSVYSPVLTGKANFIVLACYDAQDNKTHMYRTDKWIVPDATHTSSASYRPIVVTIPAGVAYVRLAIDSNGGAMTADKLKGYKLQFFEGDFTQNAGMVPFNDSQYAALADPLGFVRAETTQVGRGAEIEFEFPVLKTIKSRYDYLFKNVPVDQQRSKLFNMITAVKYKVTHRGGGLNSTGQNRNRARSYIATTTDTFWGLDSTQDSANFVRVETVFTESLRRQLTTEGSYIIISASKPNKISESGVVSDGISPAWIEVTDVNMIVELEINGKTIIEEIVAEAVRPLQVLLNQAIDRIEQLEGGN